MPKENIMHTPNRVDCYWLEEHTLDGTPSLNSIASELFGRTYDAQQTDGCLARGIYHFDYRTEGDCLEMRHMEFIEGWLEKNPEDYKYEFELSREAPRISCVLPHLILNGLLPYGEYIINIDW